MRKRPITALAIIAFALWLCPAMPAQENRDAHPDVSPQPNISEVLKSLDQNGLAQAKIGLKMNSRPARKETPGVVQQDAYPPLSLFYAEGFRLAQGDACGVTLKNDDTRLLAHSKLAQAPPPDQRYSAELFIPLNRLSVKKSKGPYRHTSNPDTAHLLGTWRTEFKSDQSRPDVVLTLFAPGQTNKLAVWEAETLTFTFDSKEMSEKFTAAFRQAINICQPVKYLKR